MISGVVGVVALLAVALVISFATAGHKSGHGLHLGRARVFGRRGADLSLRRCSAVDVRERRPARRQYRRHGAGPDNRVPPGGAARRMTGAAAFRSQFPVLERTAYLNAGHRGAAAVCRGGGGEPADRARADRRALRQGLHDRGDGPRRRAASGLRARTRHRSRQRRADGVDDRRRQHRARRPGPAPRRPDRDQRRRAPGPPGAAGSRPGPARR